MNNIINYHKILQILVKKNKILQIKHTRILSLLFYERTHFDFSKPPRFLAKCQNLIQDEVKRVSNL